MQSRSIGLLREVAFDYPHHLYIVEIARDQIAK